MTQKQRMKKAQNSPRVKSIRNRIKKADMLRKKLSSEYKSAMSKALGGKKRRKSSKKHSKHLQPAKRRR